MVLELLFSRVAILNRLPKTLSETASCIIYCPTTDGGKAYFFCSCALVVMKANISQI